MSFDEFASCPRCGNGSPDKRTRRDKVDSMLRSPLRFIHWALGGTLYHCVFCRLQFYDVRRLKSSAQREAEIEMQRQARVKAADQKPSSKAKMAS